MKWKALALVVALCVVGVWVVQSRQPEPVFRGMRWGDPPEKLGDKRIQLWSTAPYTRYMRIGDSLKMGDVELESVEYVFLNNRLVSIELVGKRYNDMVMFARAEYGGSKQMTMVDGNLVFIDTTGMPTACMILEEGVKGRMCLIDARVPSF